MLFEKAGGVRAGYIQRPHVITKENGILRWGEVPCAARGAPVRWSRVALRQGGGTEPLGAKSSSASQVALPVRLARSRVWTVLGEMPGWCK
jgi:hypothetical protein